MENSEYNAIYADGHFEKVRLGELINKGGAEGKIYANAQNQQLVIKIFHNTQKSNTNRKKLEAMILNPPTFPPAKVDNVEFVQIAWPVALIENNAGFCVGYMMPLIQAEKSVSLDHLMQKATRQKLGLPDKYAYRIFAAYNVASMVAALHQKGHYIIDLKPSNVYVYKENMLIAMLDCDGFSIQGERARYPAEFVSEEYIYPEGMNLSCEELGIEQDKFALAVIIFKLLNNGIHPFSGTPRKAAESMLTLQNRIEQYHYAYGLWPDAYQAPHPYSLHDYFDQKTMEMFDRAFTRGKERPTAEEWQKQLHNILAHLKICKKNKNHVYWTSKGCSLCAAEGKFRDNMAEIARKNAAPETVRGMDISSLKAENISKSHSEQEAEDLKWNKIGLGILAVYALFFSTLFKILESAKESLSEFGLSLQAASATLLMIGIGFGFKFLSKKISLFRDNSIKSGAIVYAVFCIIIAIIYANELPLSLLDVAK